MKKIFVCTVLLLTSAMLMLQAQKTIALQIGDKVPDLTLKMINYPKPATRLSDFKGKWLILDFWSTWCSNCIVAFPKMKALQDSFAGKLVILPATAFGDAAYNKAFFQKRKAMGKEIKLPSAVEANKLFESFPFFGLPHEVWIDDKGIVRYITDEKAVTYEVLSKVLSGEKVLLPQKTFDTAFIADAPLLVNGNGGADSDFVYRSLLIPYRQDINIGLNTEKRQHYKRIAMGNQPALTLISTAVARTQTAPGLEHELEYAYYPKRVIVETQRPALQHAWPFILSAAIDEQERLKHELLYTYELITPQATLFEDAFKKMLGDLCCFFNLQVKIEKRNVQVLKLIKTTGEDRLTTANRGTHDNYEEQLLVADLRNEPLRSFVEHSNLFWDIPYMIDSTGLTGNVTMLITLPAANDMDALSKQLAVYGLALQPAEIIMDMVVIRDDKQ